MNNFNIGDIVLFCWKPNYGFWRKGRIVANNFAMCNLPDFFGKPYYYVTLIDERDDVDDNERTYSIEKDYKYIVKFEKGMEWCIGKSSDVWPRVKLPEDIHERFVQMSDEFIDEKKMAESDYNRWKNQFRNVTLDDYKDIPGFNEIYENEKKWKEMIEKKLDDIIEKLNLLLLGTRTYTEPYPGIPGSPSNPWYEKPYKYNPDDFKVWCDTETNNNTYNYTVSLDPAEYGNYREFFSNTTDDFDYKKYNDMCTDTNCKPNYGPRESTMFGNEIIDPQKLKNKK